MQLLDETVAEDIKQIVEERPELTQEEWEIVNKAIPWIKATVTPEIRKELEVENAKKLAAYQDEMKSQNQKYIDEKFDEIKKAQEPLSNEELQKLLSQDYVEFPLVLLAPVKGDKTKKEKRNFTISELPSAAEGKFLQMFKDTFIPLLQNLDAMKFNFAADGTLLDKLKSFIEMVPDALLVAQKLTVIVLDPWEEDDEIDLEWVRNNVSVSRMNAILTAQFEANRYRDFFFSAFRSFRSLTT